MPNTWGGRVSVLSTQSSVLSRPALGMHLHGTMAKEPQSYGSGGDWVKGNVDEEVNRQKGQPNSQHSDFYANRRDSETSAPDQGGKVSPEQVADQQQPEVTKIDDDITARKPGNYFKKRDYE